MEKCCECGRCGHKAINCKSKEGGNANLIESNTIIAVISETNLIGNTMEWIVDAGATNTDVPIVDYFSLTRKLMKVKMFLW